MKPIPDEMRQKPSITSPKRRFRTHTRHNPSSFWQILQMEPPESAFPSKFDVPSLVAVVSIVVTVFFACSFSVSFLNRPPTPFCDSNSDLSDLVPGSCKPCPSNGECYEGKLGCLSGYQKHGNLCVEDGDISQTAKSLAEWVETHVCESYAQNLCEGTGAVWVMEDKLWNAVDEVKLKDYRGLDSIVYLYAKQRAREAVQTLLATRINIQGFKEVKCPEMLVEHYKPISCSIRQWIRERALILAPLCALLIGTAWFVSKVRRRLHLAARAEQLYNQICDLLEDHALSSKSLNGEAEPWVVASWLRDHLLLPKERKDPLLWKKVEELVQEDSRLDRYPKLLKGEAKVVWEWQEGSLSSSKKRGKGRVQSGGGIDPSSNQQNGQSKTVERQLC